MNAQSRLGRIQFAPISSGSLEIHELIKITISQRQTNMKTETTLNKTRKQRLQIPVDDIKTGTRMTVLRNHARCPSGHEWDYLKGTVLQVVAISLPYVLVEAFDSVRGKANLSIDVRRHVFARVSDEYANAVIASTDASKDGDIPF